jgi:hypothetical protein
MRVSPAAGLLACRQRSAEESQGPGQRVQVGLRYTGQIVTIEVDEATLRVCDHREHLIKIVPRTRREVTRHKAYGHTPTAKPARHRTHHPKPTASISWTRHEIASAINGYTPASHMMGDTAALGFASRDRHRARGLVEREGAGLRLVKLRVLHPCGLPRRPRVMLRAHRHHVHI